MRKGIVLLAAALSLGAGTAAAKEKRIVVPICGDGEGCRMGSAAYRVWDVPLRTPPALARCVLYVSRPFYAVVLKEVAAGADAPDCAELGKDSTARAAEAERRDAARKFPGHRAFLRLLCTGGPSVEYEVRGERGMMKSLLALRVAGGRAAAERLLMAARGSFPKAAVARVSAKVGRGDQDCP
ncbi:MAG: hypothetical protein KIT16_21200 [Rhodospirillaceae bacterium]|nr:hypothetical protein [Rhodospirillaceae bacterium]